MIVKLEEILFKGNVAIIAGGAICHGGLGSYLHISTSDFVNNTASISGGAVKVYFKMTLSGKNKFLNNSASVFGGAIEATYSLISMTGKQIFK